MRQTAGAAIERVGIHLLALAALGFLVSAWLGSLGSLVVAWPERFMALDFTRLRPLHTFYALAAIACGFSGLLMMVFAALGLRSRWVGARAWMLLAFVIGGGILGTLGYSNGREYVSWAPLLSPLLLLPLLLNAVEIFGHYRALSARSPEGFWLIASGAAFVCIGLLESHLWLLPAIGGDRSEEHTSELQSLMRISYAVFCLKKKTRIMTSKCLRIRHSRPTNTAS